MLPVLYARGRRHVCPLLPATVAAPLKTAREPRVKTTAVELWRNRGTAHGPRPPTFFLEGPARPTLKF